MSDRITGPYPDELETLRVLLNLPADILTRFEPQPPPPPVQRYIQHAPRPQLQWMLVDVLHQLRLRARQAEPGTDPQQSNGRGEA